jgi:hypothetical protein
VHYIYVFSMKAVQWLYKKHFCEWILVITCILLIVIDKDFTKPALAFAACILLFITTQQKYLGIALSLVLITLSLWMSAGVLSEARDEYLAKQTPMSLFGLLLFGFVFFVGLIIGKKSFEQFKQ